MVTVASPNYLARRGTPRTFEDLEGHDCLVLIAPNGRSRSWLFASGPKAVPATLLVDYGPSLIDTALAGLGVAQLFDYMADELIRDGRLVQVLPDEAADGPDVHAVCTPGRRAAARVRAAFVAFTEAFAAVGR